MAASTITERIARILAYHETTKHTTESGRLALDPGLVERPSPYRLFETCPKVSLPTTLLDLPESTVSVLRTSLDALPDSHLHPPQDLKTLATWLYMSNGLTCKKETDGSTRWLRSCPSSGALYPYEIYVGAFGLKDLEPGFYHYSPQEFSLRKLREAPQALTLLKRTWPDVGFLKTVPAVLLVSTIYWRSAWRYRTRGYRHALLDAGHLVQNIATSAMGLGIQPVVRLGIHDRAMGDLIGVSPQPDLAVAESVQAMVVWAESSNTPMKQDLPAAVGPVEVIGRQPLSREFVPYQGILAAHEACVARGVVMKEIRPPLTEASPLPKADKPEPISDAATEDTGLPLRKVLLTRRTPREFSRTGISRALFCDLNRIAFRGGSFHPICPNGPHVGIIRPFWVTHNVVGMDPGVWYYNPISDGWHLRVRGIPREKSRFLMFDQPACRMAAGVCFMVSTLKPLMERVGPDVYRLAHLEAGAIVQRMCLATASLELGCAGIGTFRDEDIRHFLGLDKTGWQPIYAMAVGAPLGDGEKPQG